MHDQFTTVLLHSKDQEQAIDCTPHYITAELTANSKKMCVNQATSASLAREMTRMLRR